MNIFLKFVSLFILLTFSPNASSSNLTQEKKESNISYNYYPYSTFTKNHLIYPVRHYSDKVSTKQVSPFTKLRNLQDSTEDNSSTEEINTNTGSTGGETTTPTNSEDSSQSESQTPTSTGNSNPNTESTTTPSEDGSTTTPTEGTSSTPSNSESDSTNPQLIQRGLLLLAQPIQRIQKALRLLLQVQKVVQLNPLRQGIILALKVLLKELSKSAHLPEPYCHNRLQSGIIRQFFKGIHQFLCRTSASILRCHIETEQFRLIFPAFAIEQDHFAAGGKSKHHQVPCNHPRQIKPCSGNQVDITEKAWHKSTIPS